MKTPRDVTGAELAKALRQLGYGITFYDEAEAGLGRRLKVDAARVAPPIREI